MRPDFLPTILGLIVIFSAMPEAVSQNDEPATKALEQGREYASKGEHQKALDLYVWYHDNVLIYEPAQYGVRLSFALGYWKQLGDTYPPAQAALIGVRDKKLKRLEGGELDRQLFTDVTSINRTLDQNEVTVALFEKMDREQPDFAKLVFPQAREAIIAANNTKLLGKYFDDPEKQLQAAVETRAHLITISSKPGFPGGSAKDSADRMYTKKVVALVGALVDLGRIDQAREIATEARKHVDNPAISAALPTQ